MKGRDTGALTWTVLWLIALAVRLVGVFLLPTAEGDGYSYAEIIARLSASLRAGHFHVTDLYGFWLPLFQFVAAIPNVWIDNPLLVGTILSSLCGATSCLLVFAITKKLTENITLAFVAFALILCNPLHILYSAAAMTDVPNTCLILASLWFLLRDRCLAAAIFAALAECVRMEAWVFVALFPLLQFVRQRRVSLLILGILLLPLLTWLIVSYLATGDAFAYFVQRARYQANYLEFYPTRLGFALADIRQNVVYFLLGANRVVILAIIGTGILSILRALRRDRVISVSVVATLCYVTAIFGLLVFAYVTKRQPVILPRYGLLFFALGLPLFMWLLGLFLTRYSGVRFVKLIAIILIALCVRETKGQLTVISKVLADFRAHQQIADALRIAFEQSHNREQRCFSDDAAVRVLSRLPADCFVRSARAPALAWQSPAAFESFLEQNHVGYLVFERIEDSLPAKHFPQLGRSMQIDPGKFQLITVALSPFAQDVWLYRLRNE